MKLPKIRIDQLLVERSITETREKAKALLMAGEVFVDGKRVDKPGTQVLLSSSVEIRGRGLPFASRGGFKLEKALETFKVDPKDLIVADIGASTGGFTDCLLQKGAKKVYAIDVGYGLLSLKVREDSRVVAMDRTNARYLTPQDFEQPLDLVTIDVSFISLELILPPISALLKEKGQVISLIKPQFEAGKGKVGKGGVVRDPKVHAAVIDKVLDKAAKCGLSLVHLTFSPLRGPAGNIEFLAGFQKNSGEETISDSVHATSIEIPHTDNTLQESASLLALQIVDEAWRNFAEAKEEE